MRKFILPLIAAFGIALASPAMAFDSGSQISMESVLDTATNLGPGFTRPAHWFSPA